MEDRLNLPQYCYYIDMTRLIIVRYDLCDVAKLHYVKIIITHT